jgi:hypothetical protein
MEARLREQIRSKLGRLLPTDDGFAWRCSSHVNMYFQRKVFRANGFKWILSLIERLADSHKKV